MRMPVKFIWWTLPLTMWLLLFSEILAIIHVYVPKEHEGGETYSTSDVA